MADVGLLRKRLKQEMEAARRGATARRARATAAAEAYERFLETAAIPAFRAMANVLKAEGFPFEVMTPSGGVRLVSERNRDNVIELELDTSADPPEPTVTTIRSRGSRGVRSERPVKPATPVDKLTEDDVVEMLMDELRPWLA